MASQASVVEGTKQTLDGLSHSLQVAVIDYRDPDQPKQFARAIHEVGFAVLANHPLEYSFIESVYAKWRDFFVTGDKTACAFDQKNHDGYVPFDQAETAKGNDTKDLKEMYHFYKWGRCPDCLRPDTEKLFNQLESLACELLSSMQHYLPDSIAKKLDRPLPDMVHQCRRSMLRPIYYPPLDGTEQPGAIRAAQHEDINMLTLIPSATAPGLQVLSKDGTWLDVPCNPNYIIINAGDLLQECTNKFYPSTTHRVINPEQTAKKSQSRFSMPLFLHAHDDVVLSERYTANSYRIERFKELGLMD